MSTALEPGRPLLQLEEDGKTYHMGEVDAEVLRLVSLEIRSGELLAMVAVGQVWYRQRDLTTFSPQELTRYRRETICFSSIILCRR